ncbi:MAG: hypothetical protein IH611_12930 [Deltaproteobacteria bacterium]|nr:hypothetical protein [Deltaproteobacteria bacterium]
MRVVTVYRVDFDRKTKYPVGVVLEQRQTERGENYKDLLRLARRTFARDTTDAVNIVIDSSQAKLPCFPAQSRDCPPG